MDQKEIYDKVWSEVDTESPRPFLEYKMSFILDFLHGRNIKDVLDVGCGDGFFTLKMLELGFRVDSLDVSSEAIKSTKKKIDERSYSSNASLYHKDIFEFEPGKKYDLILCLEIIEHLKDDYKTLKRLNGLLKKGGLLIVSVPHRQDLWNYSDEVGGHYRRYSKSELTDKLKLTNFRVDQIFDYGFPFIRFFVNGFCLPFSKKQKSNIKPPKNSFLTNHASKIIRNLCKVDSLFINNSHGINLIALAEKV